MRPQYRAACAILGLVGACSCVITQRQLKSNALEYLYPTGAPEVPASDVRLSVPSRVGIAFAPPTAGWPDSFTEQQKQGLLETIAAAFRDRPEIRSVQTIPGTYLKTRGGFADLDRVASAFGIDLIALVSYEQIQFSESGRASLAYWTVVGAYLVKGEKNETRTMLDAAVFDISSRAMLFHAGGRSGVAGRATPVGTGRALRERSTAGFEQAVTDLVANLATGLDAFQEQARSGTVRGPGTPAIAFVDEHGQPIAPGRAGGGAAGLGELAAAMLLAAAGGLAWRARTSRRS